MPTYALLRSISNIQPNCEIHLLSGKIVTDKSTVIHTVMLAVPYSPCWICSIIMKMQTSENFRDMTVATSTHHNLLQTNARLALQINQISKYVLKNFLIDIQFNCHYFSLLETDNFWYLAYLGPIHDTNKYRVEVKTVAPFVNSDIG